MWCKGTYNILNEKRQIASVMITPIFKHG